MTTEREPDREREAKVPDRAPYAPPRLVRHGAIEELTRGGPGVVAGDLASNF